MTNEARKSIRAAAGVLACVAAVGGGAVLRDRVELASVEPGERVSLSNLVASTSQQAQLPETKFFEDMLELLKRKYVDPIADDGKLADGAVRGMVASLGDPNSLYMDADQYRVYSAVRLGRYEGIGADLTLERDRTAEKVKTTGLDDPTDNDFRLPRLTVAAVVPGSTADKAGLKAGDWIQFVDSHWIPDSDVTDELQALSERVKNGKATADEFLQRRREIRDEIEKSIFAIKARDRLMMGSTGSVKVQWMSGKASKQATIQRGQWEMPGFVAGPDGSIRLPFVEGSSVKLKDALRDKAAVTIDLRNNVDGDFDEMVLCLKALAPKGQYGSLFTHKSEKPWSLSLDSGSNVKREITLLTDRTTRGAAEIFATALSSRLGAKMSSDRMAGVPYVVRWYKRPDGVGYTLVTAEYAAKAPTEIVARAEASDGGAK